MFGELNSLARFNFLKSLKYTKIKSFIIIYYKYESFRTIQIVKIT